MNKYFKTPLIPFVLESISNRTTQYIHCIPYATTFGYLTGLYTIKKSPSSRLLCVNEAGNTPCLT